MGRTTSPFRKEHCSIELESEEWSWKRTLTETRSSPATTTQRLAIGQGSGSSIYRTGFGRAKGFSRRASWISLEPPHLHGNSQSMVDCFGSMPLDNGICRRTLITCPVRAERCSSSPHSIYLFVRMGHEGGQEIGLKQLNVALGELAEILKPLDSRSEPPK